ncbi:MAG TPA: YlxR family protein [Nakamurella sp.]
MIARTSVIDRRAGRTRSGQPVTAGSARLSGTDRPRAGAVDAPTGRPPGPQRTCIGCRMRERDVELLRVVVVAGAVIPDMRRRLPGRGAWLHRDLRCYDLAQRRRAFGRALRGGPELDTTSVRAYLATSEPGRAPDSTSEGRDGRTPADQPVGVTLKESRSTQS